MNKYRMRSGEFKSNYHKQLAPMKALLSSIILCFVLSGIGRLLGVAKELPTTEVEAQVVPEPTLTATPSPTPTPIKTEKQEIIDEIVRVFGEEAPEAITIVRGCENKSLDPMATNWNRNGTWDAGIFMVNQVHGYTMEEMQDYKKNIQAAYKIFKRSGWSAWACSEIVGIKPFWK